MNNFNPFLKFTIELPIDNKIPFLETLYLSCTDASQTSIVENQIYTSITYIKGLSETIRRILRSKFLEKSIVFNYKNSVGNKLFSKTKDATPILERSNVVYCVKCEDCGLKYIGQTSNRIRFRMNEWSSL